MDPGPHNGVGPGGVSKAQSVNASSIVLRLSLLRHCIVGHVQATCKNVVINIFGRLLQGNDMPPSCIFSEGIFFHLSRSRVPVVDAESLLC